MHTFFKTGTVLTALGLCALWPVIAAAETPKLPSSVRDISQMEVDRQQLRQAVAARTLTWLTGSASSNDYVSVGRLANFFGFVALRVSSGHSLSRADIAKETLHVLSPAQDQALIALVETQKSAFTDVDVARRAMNRALEGLLVGEEVTREEFLKLGEAYGAAEAELGRVVAQSLGRVAHELTDTQKAELMDIRTRYLAGQEPTKKVPGIKTELSQEDKKELVNVAARLLSWSTGMQAFNDFEVVGKPSQHFGFVSLRVESNHGVTRGGVANQVRDLLTPQQDALLEASAIENVQMFEGFMAVRGPLMRLLETAQSGAIIDKAAGKSLGEKMGALEAEMTWSQASAMLGVRRSMSESQLSGLLAMRAKYTGKSADGGVIDDPIARGRQLYAQCSLCHNDESDYAIAPSLYQIVGRAIANDPAYDNYSDAMKAYARPHKIWGEDALAAFLSSPRSEVPGTFMGFTGLESKADREALIAYLKTRK